MWRKLLIVWMVFIAALFTAVPVMAGGWAVISLDSLPGEVNAGQKITVGFTVLQHGKTPMEGLNPVIVLTNAASGEALTVYAEPEGETGHYSATFTLPEAGRWSWSIEAFTMEQPMPELVVSGAPGQAVETRPSINSLPSTPLILGIVGTTVAVLGMISMLRRRSKWAAAAIMIGALAGVAGFAQAGIATSAVRAAENNQSSSAAEKVDTIQRGEDLFVAKGCVSCHINQRVGTRYLVFSTEIGPNLTRYQTSQEYLQLWLSDPPSVKPNTEMPNLGLSPAEIDALVAFLLQGDPE